MEFVQEEEGDLVIAKLYRLSRNMAFISALIESGTPFVCCDNPHANNATLQMMAVCAEYEREQISEREMATLRRVKAELALSCCLHDSLHYVDNAQGLSILKSARTPMPTEAYCRKAV